MKRLSAFAPAAILFVATIQLWGCDRLPGKPNPSDRPLRPTEVRDFDRLYGDNCAGCHGANGRFGAAIELDNPVYQALVDDNSLKQAIGNGVAGTSMPAFVQSAGGDLTDEQIDILVAGMRRRWKRGPAVAGMPPYAASSAGNPSQGAQVYSASCQGCHGPQGKGGARAGSISDGSFLLLVSNQSLRSLVIAGRPDLGHPDWRGYLSGQPLTPQQVADVVAWLTAQRPEFAAGD